MSVALIIATHGAAGEQLIKTTEMLVGEQTNVGFIEFMPGESPDDILDKYNNLLSTSLQDCDEVLFLVDLWGGSPFNAASKLIADKNNMDVVTGVNVPMLVETFLAKDTTSLAELVAIALENGATGISALKNKPQKPSIATTDKNAISPGTVIGDGKIKYVLARLDSRLLHGQVATAWTKETNPNRIIVVSDEVSKDSLRKKLIEQAAPPGVKANVVPISKMIEVAKDPRFGGTKALLLFENPQDVLRAVNGGVDIKLLNVGSMAHSVGKVAVNKVLSIGHDDILAFEQLVEKGVTFDVRKVPNDSTSNMQELINKAKKELVK